jgi:hypothetical protein
MNAVKSDYDKYLLEKKKQTADFTRWLSWKGRGGFVCQYVGGDIGFVREWISNMFVSGMSWENYGSYWVVDHIVPFRVFNIFDENDLKILWNYRNFMPLLIKDNLKKQGNVFFSYELLSHQKDKDHIYAKLFDRVKPEFDWMVKYIDNYRLVFNSL